MPFEEEKKILEEEKIKLERELSSIARKNPDNPEDWQVKAPQMNPMVSDQSELADVFEELETQAGIEYQLEERLKKVNEALKNMAEGKYGLCVQCGKPIEEKRLKANPIAKGCIKHAIFPPWR
ncbi:TraR/DksA C4-type zinc finger protein [Candidatus Giovannonibacteria bacterium]|nr:TraR/DksA C4-type zinc finger protein [Candidatus Giovannonibacteria bacterium]